MTLEGEMVVAVIYKGRKGLSPPALYSWRGQDTIPGLYIG